MNPELTCFSAPEMLSAAKLGILAGSILSAEAGLVTLVWIASRARQS